jgi:hypothetical protein
MVEVTGLERNLIAWLAARPPLFWGALYLSCIPTFAVIFTIISGFNETNIKTESSTRNDADTLATSICQDFWPIDKKINATTPDGNITFNIGIAESDGCQGLIQSEGFQFIIFLRLNFPNSKQWLRYGSLEFVNEDHVITIEWPTYYRVAFISAVDENGKELSTVCQRVDVHESIKDWAGSGSTPALRELAQVHDAVVNAVKNSSLFKEDHRLCVTPHTFERLEKYMKGTAGSTSDVSGNLWRMLYLSAVVITTLGFGDIVPITAEARACVAIEAVLGVVLAGLFLNALAVKTRTKQQ